MKPCCTEGELRALWDRELPAEQALAAQQHLAECAGCAAAYQALGDRAARVAVWMDALSESVPGAAPLRRRSFGGPAVWITAAAALAAGWMLAVALSRQSAQPPVKALVQPPSVAQPIEPQAPPVTLPVTTAAAAVSAPRVHRLPSRSVSPSPVQYYMALDEEPIDTGLVMRVALPSGLQADVIVDGDGRARAIRPVSTVNMKEER
ncbi:MAG TPA: zf-HC2 domain-containing protein [Candidatus Sulfopaludibacter sp.]|jgi:hypothetical protein|nr:zf-HC2 domain-containing protein [Candidatus Sulfopaludibacter sp.]